MRFCFTFLVLWVFTFLPVANAQDAIAPAERLEAIEMQVNEAEQALTDESAQSQLSDVRLRLQETRVQLQELQRSFSTSKAQLETDLSVLGPVPETGNEALSVSQLRDNYATRIAEYDRLSVLSSALRQKITRLLEASAEQLRDAFVQRFLERSPLPYLPQQISGAGAELSSVATTASAWFGTLIPSKAAPSRNPIVSLALVFASIALLYILNVPVRDRVARVLWRRIPKRELTPAGPPAIALTRTSTRIVLGAIGLFAVHRIIIESGLLPDGAREGLTNVIQALFILVTANAISRGLFSPDNQQWRVPKISNAVASGAHWGALAVATLFTVDQIIVAFFGRQSLGAFLRLETLIAAIIFGIVMITVHRRLRATAQASVDPAGMAANDIEDAIHQADEPTKSEVLGRLFLLAPAVVMVGASLLGYASLSRWIFEKAALFALFLGYAYLLRAFLGSWTLLAVERIAFGKSRNEIPQDDIVGFWTKAVVNTLLLVAAIPIALGILGMEPTEIRTGALSIMSGFSIGSIRIAPGNIVYGLLLVVVILVITRLLQRVLENRILPMTRLNPGIRHSFKTLVGYVGLVFAFLTGVSAFGFDLSNLAIIAGALSVGIGFGLQSVVNNFVSGLILLFERPIKIGDWVITASGQGTVKKINVRSTEIETFDRCSIIVPNSELISSSVQNWTYKDQSARVIVPIGVAYDTDPQYAREVLLKCAEGEDKILNFPQPFVYFADFADSALNLELRVFIKNANDALIVRNELRFKIYSALKEAGIEIPFPQRDINLRRGIKELAEAVSS